MRTQNDCSTSLRDYQETCLDRIKNILEFVCPVKCYCFVLPTGAGKSVIIGAAVSSILEDFEIDGLKILVCSWSRKIVKQDYEKCLSFNKNLNVDFMQVSENRFCAKNKISGDNVVDFMTVQSLPNCKKETYDLILVDECHKMYTGTSGYKEIVSRMINCNGKLRNTESSTIVLGFTATPYRNRKETVLGGDMFLAVEESVTYRRLIDEGYLVKPEYIKCALFEMDREKLEINSIGDFSSESMEKQCEKALNAIARTVVETHTRGAQNVGKSSCTLVFLPTLRICDEVLAKIKKIEAKEKAKFTVDVIKGETSDDDREDIICNCDIILNCGVLTTGVDITRVTSIVMCRATKSWTLWKQIIGRGLRLHSGKSKCFVIDCGGNVEQFGDDLDREMSCGGVGVKRLPIMSECKQCHRYVHTSVKECPFCGNVLRTDEQIHALKLQRLYFEGGLLPVESYSEKIVNIPGKGRRCNITVKFAYGKQRVFTFSEHPFSQQKYKEYSDVLKHSKNPKEILFIKVETVKGFDTITDAKVIDV